MGFRQGTALGLILYFPGDHLCSSREGNGSKLEPCVTPASTLAYEKNRLFETTRYFLSFEKSVEILRRFF